MDMRAFRQKEFGGKVASDLLLSGAGSSMYILYYSLFLDRLNEASPAMILSGFAIVLIGLFFLLSELGRPRNFWRMAKNWRRSWMARGVIFNSLYLLDGLGIALAYALGYEGIIEILGALGLAFAALVLIYPVMLLRDAEDIELWRRAGSSIVILLSALSTGATIISALSLFIQPSVLKVSLEISMALILATLLASSLYSSSLGRAEELEREAKKTFNSILVPYTISLAIYALAIFSSQPSLQGGIALISSFIAIYGSLEFRLNLLGSGLHPPIVKEDLFKK